MVLCDAGCQREATHLWLSASGLPLDLCQPHAVQAEMAGLDEELAEVSAR